MSGIPTIAYTYVDNPKSAMSICQLALCNLDQVDKWVLLSPDGSSEIDGVIQAYCHVKNSKLHHKRYRGVNPKNLLDPVILESQSESLGSTIIYVDQDTVYIAPFSLNALAEYKIEHPMLPCVYPAIIGTERATYVHQTMGLHPTWLFGKWTHDYIDTLDFDREHINLQVALHKNFLKYMQDKPGAEDWKFGECKLVAADKAPWMCFAFTSGSTSWADRILRKHTNLLANMMPKTAIFGDSIIAHVSKQALLHPEATSLKYSYSSVEKLQGGIYMSPAVPAIAAPKPTIDNTTFIVATHKVLERSEAATCIRLLYAGCNIPKERLLIVSGGHANEETSYIDGVRVQRVCHNSYEHGALIYAVESNLNSPYIFMLHDSTRPGSGFIESALNPPKDCGYVACLEHGWLNIGLFKNEFLQKHSTYILSLKNCSKLRAILSEKLYSRFGGMAHYQDFSGVRFDGFQYAGAQRQQKSIFYMPKLDLYKHQTYFLHSPQLQALFKAHYVNAQDALKLIEQ